MKYHLHTLCSQTIYEAIAITIIFRQQEKKYLEYLGIKL